MNGICAPFAVGVSVQVLYDRGLAAFRFLGEDACGLHEGDDIVVLVEDLTGRVIYIEGVHLGTPFAEIKKVSAGKYSITHHEVSVKADFSRFRHLSGTLLHFFNQFQKQG